MFKTIYLLAVAFCCINLAGCYAVRPSAGGGKLSEVRDRALNPSDIALPDGYKVEVVASGLTFPTGVAFDDKGTPHVVEAGYSYGEVWEVPRLLRLQDGKATIVAE
ncbi:MAG: glucose dehydrogenase, partial [Geobacter sp.]